MCTTEPHGHPERYGNDSAVTHWLTGTTPRVRVRPLIAEALSRRLGRRVTQNEAGFPEAAATSPTTAVDGLIDLGRQDMDPSRRTMVGLSAGLFSVALTIPDWPDVIGRIEAVRTGGRAHRIGYSDVDVVTAMTERVSDLDDRFGGRHARPMAAAFLVNTVSAYLQADASPDVRRAILSAASDLSYLTGYMAVDEGLHGLAQLYYVKALELAGAAEDHLTYCTTLRGMSVQAVDLGLGAQALRLADAAAAAAPQAGPRMRAFLAGQQAHSAAQTGDRSNALAFMAQAERAMDIAESQAKAFGSYDPAALKQHEAQVKFAFGDVRGSVASLKESQSLRPPSYRRAKVRLGALLAERQLQIGHLEAACASWHTALDDYPLVRSGRCDERMAEMKSLLRPHLRNRAARDLYERARSVTVGGV